jgi:large subunit ribosomal protein L3
MRVGLLTKKVGMTRIFNESGENFPVTILECPEAVVIDAAKNAPNNVRLGSFEVKESRVNKPQKSLFKNCKSTPKAKTYEFKVEDASQYKQGEVITVQHFVEGQYVDVQATSSGKGFAGAMKRHNFAGLEASHGISVSHRSHGSTGQCQDPGRVFKGKKMAGHLGDATVKVQNLEILRIDSDNSLIYIKGSVPGKSNAYVKVRDAVKKHLPKDAPLPAFFKSANIANQEVVSQESAEESKEDNSVSKE